MATSTPGAQKPAATNEANDESASRRRPDRARHSDDRERAAHHPGATTSTQPKTRVEQAQVLAERAVLVPVGASLLARDNLVSTVKGLATKYGTRDELRARAQALRAPRRHRPQPLRAPGSPGTHAFGARSAPAP